jgi:hypothetical protein
MHKLTNCEAQRVIAVMEDTLDKLNALSYVPSSARLDLLEALGEAGANPVKSCLQTQWHLEQNAIKTGAMGDARTAAATAAAAARAAAAAAAHAAGDTFAETQQGDTLQQIYQSTRTLCRSLRQHARGMEVSLICRVFLKVVKSIQAVV